MQIFFALLPLWLIIEHSFALQYHKLTKWSILLCQNTELVNYCPHFLFQVMNNEY